MGEILEKAKLEEALDLLKESRVTSFKRKCIIDGLQEQNYELVTRIKELEKYNKELEKDVKLFADQAELMKEERDALERGDRVPLHETL